MRSESTTHSLSENVLGGGHGDLSMDLLLWRIWNGRMDDRLLTARVEKGFLSRVRGKDLESSMGVGYARHCTSDWEF